MGAHDSGPPNGSRVSCGREPRRRVSASTVFRCQVAHKGNSTLLGRARQLQGLLGGRLLMRDELPLRNARHRVTRIKWEKWGTNSRAAVTVLTAERQEGQARAGPLRTPCATGTE